MMKKTQSTISLLRIAFATLFSFALLQGWSQNPYLPMWEYIPDGEPYVFDDPDCPGKKRIYIYGSHDSMITGYCGRELVTWSASVDSLDRWRYDGVILEVKKNPNGEYLHQEKWGDVFYAPDVAEKVEADGTKTYYLYPNNQCGGRNGMVAKSKRPDGPFEVINWNPENPNENVGDLRFDPAVFIDDDGRVYGYWGFEEAYAAELDPTTMATVKPGTQVMKNYINHHKELGIFRFFEASSMRKIKDKYVLIYSRYTGDGEFGLPTSNYTLAYAYSNSPLGPFVYGGTIIDGRARDVDNLARPIATATINGNTHGSICEINGQWWVFYHRQTGLDEFSRQAMVAPIEVQVTEGIHGKVYISEGEYTSEGFATQGLNPFKRHSAGITCYYTGPKPAIHNWPNKTFFGSYVKPLRLEKVPQGDPYDLSVNHNPVINNTDGSTIGYKYFNFDYTYSVPHLQLKMNVLPLGVDATIEVYVDSPYPSRGGKLVGEFKLSSSLAKKITELKTDVPALSQYQGKHALFFVVKSAKKGKSVCELHDFVFAVK
ncbi:MAG: family 43 glycosylhydrolase [Bacteroidaceae bacterium]|nr:family 43 glycosylhydrolase [Bacteroidaceae bacterium]